MAIDTALKRTTAIATRRLPWIRRYTSLPLMTRRGLGYTYEPSGSAPVVEIANMEDVSLRQVYTTLISTAGIVANPMEVTTMSNYITSLTVNPEVNNYDWSGTSIMVKCYRNGAWLLDTMAATLISPTHALTSGHYGPLIGDTCFWRTPAGAMASATVIGRTAITGTNGEIVALRFATTPNLTLKRYPIASQASFEDYVAAKGFLRLLYTDLRIRLRVLYYLGTQHVIHANSSWDNDIAQGSGRPALVALSDNTLVITGTMWTRTSNARLHVTALNDILEPYSETVTGYDLPISDPNIAGDVEMINTVFNSHIFGRGTK